MKRETALAQLDIQLGNPAENHQKAKQTIEEAASHHADVIVLPGMWNTGYTLDQLPDLADENGQKAQKFLSELALENLINIVGGSIAVRHGQSFFNTTYVYDQKGNLVSSYEKVHLFGPMNEDRYLKTGQKENHSELAGVPSANFTCYGLRFSEWIRTVARYGTDILYFSAEWPNKRIKQWKVMLQSRAIENRTFVVAVNRVGTDLENSFNGHSLVIDPLGQIIHDAGEVEQISYTGIDLAQLTQIRRPIPVFKDRRPSLYH